MARGSATVPTEHVPDCLSPHSSHHQELRPMDLQHRCLPAAGNRLRLLLPTSPHTRLSACLHDFCSMVLISTDRLPAGTIHFLEDGRYTYVSETPLFVIHHVFCISSSQTFLPNPADWVNVQHLMSIDSNFVEAIGVACCSLLSKSKILARKYSLYLRLPKFP